MSIALHFDMLRLFALIYARVRVCLYPRTLLHVHALPRAAMIEEGGMSTFTRVRGGRHVRARAYMNRFTIVLKSAVQQVVLPLIGYKF